MDERILQLIITEAHKNGWKEIPLGMRRSNGQTKQMEGFLVLVRNRRFGDFLAESPKRIPATPL